MKQTIPFEDEQAREKKKRDTLVCTPKPAPARVVVMQTSLESVDEWIGGISGAALAGGIPLQLCLSWPADALAALVRPSITHIRASIDDFPGQFPTRWRIGMTSMLLSVLAVRPFTDGTWTTSVQPGNPYGDSVNATYPELAVLVAALSAGPVAIGDGIGLTNASLVASTCMSDGLLLRPSTGATFLDGQVCAIVWRALYTRIQYPSSPQM